MTDPRHQTFTFFHSIFTSQSPSNFVDEELEMMAAEGDMPYPKLKSDSSAISAASATSGVSETSDENRLTPPPTGIHITSEASACFGGLETGGRIKAPPVCVSAVLKNKAMTPSQLNDMIFPASNCPIAQQLGSVSQGFSSISGDLPLEDTSILPVVSSYSVGDSALLPPIPASVSVVATSSSCCASIGSLTRDCDVAASSDSETKSGYNGHCFKNFAESEKFNAKILQQKGSRQGRASQRWVTPHDSTFGEPIRLVVGTVPILKGGKILFVSASRKPEWILPKGGWEGDESMEESAIRESFEEAGVIGTLGSALSPIQYETRKSKKRRLEIEDLRHHVPTKSDELLSSSSETASPDIVPLTHNYEQEDVRTTITSNTIKQSTESPASGSNHPAGYLSAEDIARIRTVYQTSGKLTDETISVGSTLSSSYSFVKMTLFPLYVTQVLNVWPESGRLRTAVDIDVAIDMMETRPEFRAVLKEVKALGLHLWNDKTDNDFIG